MIRQHSEASALPYNDVGYPALNETYPHTEALAYE